MSISPIPRNEPLDRLALLSPLSNVADDLWALVHEEIQKELVVLEAAVRRNLPNVRVNVRRTRGPKFHLFTYRSFAMPDANLDPVVVGITCTAAPAGVSIEGDVSGEETGDLILSLPAMNVPESAETVLEAARGIARKLCQSAPLVVAALSDPSRRNA